MKKLFLLILGAMAFFTVSAQDIKITHGPYLTDMTTDGVTVVWTTNKPALSWVELAPGDNKSFYAEERPKYYETFHGRKQGHKTVHTVRITGLQPGTQYNYRIFSQETTQWGGRYEAQFGTVVASNVYSRKPYTFKTFDDKAGPVSFMVVNDVHERGDHLSQLLRNADMRGVEFVALNGDLISKASSEEQVFAGFIDTCVAVFATDIPMMLNRGNHETRGPFSDKLYDYFPTTDGKFYQHYRIGDISFLLLDCGEDKPDSDIEYGGLADFDNYRKEEAEWLKKVVASDDFKSSKVKIAFLHIPLSSDSWHGNVHLRELFMPLLNGTGIDLMLSGHTHRYAFIENGRGPDFPVLINDNNSCLRCDVTGDAIEITITDNKGQTVKKHSLKRKK